MNIEMVTQTGNSSKVVDRMRDYGVVDLHDANMVAILFKEIARANNLQESIRGAERCVGTEIMVAELQHQRREALSHANALFYLLKDRVIEEQMIVIKLAVHEITHPNQFSIQ